MLSAFDGKKSPRDHKAEAIFDGWLASPMTQRDAESTLNALRLITNMPVDPDASTGQWLALPADTDNYGVQPMIWVPDCDVAPQPPAERPTRRRVAVTRRKMSTLTRRLKRVCMLLAVTAFCVGAWCIIAQCLLLITGGVR